MVGDWPEQVTNRVEFNTIYDKVSVLNSSQVLDELVISWQSVQWPGPVDNIFPEAVFIT